MMVCMWKDIVGHAEQVSLLKSYVVSGKVPHAFLFCGPRGVGKTKAAYEFFKAANCLNSSPDPCDVCRNCIKANTGSHPDLVTLRVQEGWIQVRDVRSVIDDIGLKPFEARLRFVVIEPAEQMNKASANALLKTLEEPPEGTVIILVSHQPALLLPTIVSRCQVIRFSPLDVSSCRELSIDPAILRLTSGSVGSLGGLDRDDVVDIRTGVVDIARGEDPFDLIVKYFSTAGQDKNVALAFLLVTESVIRDMLILYHGGGGEGVINPELAELSVRYMNLDAVSEVCGCIRRIRQGMNENINLRNAVCELLMLLRDIAAVRA